MLGTGHSQADHGKPLGGGDIWPGIQKMIFFSYAPCMDILLIWIDKLTSLRKLNLSILQYNKSHKNKCDMTLGDITIISQS